MVDSQSTVLCAEAIKCPISCILWLFICNGYILNWLSQDKPPSTTKMCNLSLQFANVSPRLDWMARRIQGKHFTSKSELIIDPFPELQMTLVRAKSEESERKKRKLEDQMGLSLGLKFFN